MSTMSCPGKPNFRQNSGTLTVCHLTHELIVCVSIVLCSVSNYECEKRFEKVKKDHKLSVIEVKEEANCFQ